MVPFPPFLALIPTYPDPNEILQFLSALLSRIDKSSSPAAYILAVSSLAHAKLVFGDMIGTKADMDECSKILDDLDGVETNVSAAFYGVSADYFKVSKCSFRSPP